MRAVLVSEFGGPEQLRLGQAADPVAGPGQVRIAVHAAGVNPVDAGNRADGRWAGLRLPCILGYDVAGVIDSLGPGVSGLVPGDRVMAMTHFPDGAGGYAELAVSRGRPGRAISPRPRLPTRLLTLLPPEPHAWFCPGSACPPEAGFWRSAPAAALGCSYSSWPPPQRSLPAAGRRGHAWSDDRPGRRSMR